MLLVDMIYVLIQPEADERGVSDEQFGSSLGGESIMDAQDAFYEELILFFHGLRRGDLVTALKKQKTLIQKAIQEVDLKIQKIDLDELVQKAFASGKPSTNLPELSE